MFVITSTKTSTRYASTKEAAMKYFLDSLKETFGCGPRVLRAKGGEVTLTPAFAKFNGDVVLLKYVEIV